jgi:ATP-binding cassette, subfamily B, bacterial
VPRRRPPAGPSRAGAAARDLAEPGGPGGLAALAASRWEGHHDSLVRTGLGRIARRLPAMVARAVAIGWRASRRDTVAVLALTALAGAATGWGLLSTRGVLRALFAAGPTPDRLAAAAPSLAGVAVAVALRAGAAIGASWAQGRLAPRALTAAERRLFELTTAVDLAAYDDPRFADALERARSRGAQSVPELVKASGDLAAGLAGLAGTAVTLAVLHPLLLAALLLAAVPAVLTAVRAARVAYESVHARTSRRRRLWMLSDLMALRDTAAELRAYTMRGQLLGEYDRVVRLENAAELAVVARQTRVRLAGSALAGLAALATYAVLGALLLRGGLPLAAAGTAVLALQAGRQSLTMALGTVNRLYEQGLYFGDYTAFLAAARRRLPAAGPAPAAPVCVRLRGATLHYSGSAVAAVRDVRLTVHRGQTIALVGENGSGKTSLARLIAGLYRPDAGEVLWDGVPPPAGEPAWRHVAMVSQDYWHWPFTAEHNIRLGAPGSAPDVRPAAEAAGAHEMIMDLPAGYDTLLSQHFEGGRDLSGGQWQRLAAARAFHRDAPLLICDEPSAALDARAEHRLFAALRAGAAGRITVLITHRLANVRHADRIYVLDRGRVVEEGTHPELVAAGGRYAELFALQLDGYVGSDARAG